jgi:hypothetical protein
MSEDVKKELADVNSRLKELSTEFKDLNALKKELTSKGTLATIKEKYSDYTIVVKKKENAVLDFGHLLKEGDLKVGRSSLGLAMVAYDLNGPVNYHIARNEEEANQIRVIQAINSVGDSIEAKIKEEKHLSSQEILDLYDGARDGHQLSESEESEEIS